MKNGRKRKKMDENVLKRTKTYENEQNARKHMKTYENRR